MSNEPDEVNNGALATILGLVALSTLAVALVVTALVRTETAELRAERDLTQERAFRSLRAEQLVALSGAPKWADKEQGLAKVSIDRSMELVVNQVRRSPSALTPTPPPKEEKVDEVAEEDVETPGDASGKEASTTVKSSTAKPVNATAKPASLTPKSPAKKPAAPAATPVKKPAAPALAKKPAAPAPVTKTTK